MESDPGAYDSSVLAPELSSLIHGVVVEKEVVRFATRGVLYADASMKHAGLKRWQNQSQS